jgi:hypothetical protein
MDRRLVELLPALLQDAALRLTQNLTFELLDEAKSMAVNFETSEPQALLATFRWGIDRGHIVTWSYDSDGDFTHTPEQWCNKAWFRPTIYTGRLIMNILGRKAEMMPLVVYSVYHGRFVEAMIAHCRTRFALASATPAPTNSDPIQIAA